MSDLEKAYDLVCLVTNDIATDRRMHRTCSKLTSAGWNVLLIGRNVINSKKIASYPFDTFRVDCKYSQGALFYIEILWRFRKVLKKLCFNRLLCTDLDSLGVLNILDTKEVEVYFDAHEYFTEVPELSNAFIKKRIWSKWGRIAMRNVDKAYTVGPELANILGDKYNTHFDVIRNVPELNEISPGIKDHHELTLVYLGVLNPGRGLELLIDVVKGRNDVRLKIIGDGPLSTSLRLQAQGCKRIEFTGALPPLQLSAILSEADVGVNLLISNSKSYYYSLANKFFDYLHAGLPVLCMNYPEYKSISDLYDCIYPIHELSRESLNQQIDSIDRTSSNWSHKIQESLLAAAVYNWQTEGEKLLELYELK